MRSKPTFYLWYAGLEEQEKKLKYLIDNVGYSRGMSYDYKGGKTNKRTSIVEAEAEELERLEADYWKLVDLNFIVTRLVLDTIHFNFLGYKVVRSKLENKDIREVKGRESLKACKEAEQRVIEYIKENLNKRNIGFYF